MVLAQVFGTTSEQRPRCSLVAIGFRATRILDLISQVAWCVWCMSIPSNLSAQQDKSRQEIIVVTTSPVRDRADILRFFSTPPAKIKALIYEIKNTSKEKGTVPLPLSPGDSPVPLSLERLEQALTLIEEEEKNGMMDLHRFAEVVTGVADQQDIKVKDAEKWALAVWVR